MILLTGSVESSDGEKLTSQVLSPDICHTAVVHNSGYPLLMYYVHSNSKQQH